MGFFDRLTAQFIEIIEWTEDDRDVMVYRFPVYAKEIKNGAKLVVREGQAAVFIREGQLADVMRPGTYTLDTKNLPILSTLLGWKYGFESPFKCEVYFITTRLFSDLKWGTPNPIMMRDQDFGVVRLRAFGSYAIKITDPGLFLKDIVGTDGLFETSEISNYLRDMLIQSFTTALASAKVPALDLASNYKEIGASLTTAITNDFAQHGLTLNRFLISNISVPPEVEAALDKRSEMGAIGDLNRFTQFQVANSIPDAAKNPGGLAGAGMGLGAGMLMGNQMAGAIGQSMSASQQPPVAPASVPAGAPAAGEDIVAKLGQLKKMLDAGLIEKAEYDEKKKEMLSKM
ncbi:MAG TPA: SPFH domain-containing protein [Planctomycetota bacterium]|jgi:membrane protease subunit (stomatin/prohibitin family)